MVFTCSYPLRHRVLVQTNKFLEELWIPEDLLRCGPTCLLFQKHTHSCHHHDHQGWGVGVHSEIYSQVKIQIIPPKIATKAFSTRDRHQDNQI